MNDRITPQAMLSVLVVEDEEALRRVFRRFLENSGYLVSEAATGKEALESVAQQRPSLVLLDAMLPGMSGFDVCEELRKLPKGEHIPILVITSLDDERSISRAFNAGATDYLTKPVRLTVLCERIRRLVQAARLEEQLAATNAYLQTLVRNVPDGIVTFDAQGFVESLNPAAERILGCPQEWAVGRNIQSLLGVRNLDAVEQWGAAFETVGRRPDGTMFDLEISVNEFSFNDARRFTAIVRDITARKQSENALKQSQQKFEGLVNSIDGIVFEFDVETRRFTFVSQQAEFFLGYPLSMWMTDPEFWPNHIHSEDREGAVNFCNEATLKKEDHEFEYRMIAADGREVWLRDLVKVVVEDDKPKMLRGVMVDITKQRMTEEALRRSQKMEAVGRLAGGMAHDFNNLLTVIKGYSQLLLLRQRDDPTQRQYIEEIKKSADRSTSLIRQLLAFSRRQILTPQVLDLNMLIGDIKKMMERLIGEDIELVTSLGPELGRVKADISQIEQVIVNLVVNARDAMPNGGRLTIGTDNSYLDENFTRHRIDLKPGHYVKLFVRDTGVGMDEDTKSRIYEPFFTTKALDKGTGLGLSTVYGIVTQSNGYIEVETSPGQGTVFTMYLPRVEEEVEVAEPKADVDQAQLLGAETVLVTEDNDQLRSLVCESLQRKGYHVLEACRGDEALRICDLHPNRIHLIVTDVVMPKMSGPEFVAKALAKYPDLHVIFMSGYAKDIALDSVAVTGRVTYLWKPFEPDDLIRAVRAVLDGKRVSGFLQHRSAELGGTQGG